MAPSSCSRACPFLPAQVPCYPGVLTHWEPPPSFGPPWGGTAGHRAWGTISFQKKGFQAKPRDKRPSVHPSVPSPGFPEQHSFMPLPRLLQPLPLNTLPSFTASVVSLFVCHAECRLSVVLLFSLPLMHPPSKPSAGTQGLGPWRRAGSKGRVRARGLGPPH